MDKKQIINDILKPKSEEEILSCLDNIRKVSFFIKNNSPFKNRNELQTKMELFFEKYNIPFRKTIYINKYGKCWEMEYIVNINLKTIYIKFTVRHSFTGGGWRRYF